jgi:hypothetical protein
MDFDDILGLTKAQELAKAMTKGDDDSLISMGAKLARQGMKGFASKPKANTFDIGNIIGDVVAPKKKKRGFEWIDLIAPAVKNIPNAYKAYENYAYKRDRPGEFGHRAVKREALGDIISILTDTATETVGNYAKRNKMKKLYRLFAHPKDVEHQEKRWDAKKLLKEKKEDYRQKNEREDKKFELERFKAGVKKDFSGYKKGSSPADKEALEKLKYKLNKKLWQKKAELKEKGSKNEFDRKEGSKKNDINYLHQKQIVTHPYMYEPKTLELLKKDISLTRHLTKMGSGADAYYDLPPEIKRQHSGGGGGSNTGKPVNKGNPTKPSGNIIDEIKVTKVG